MTESTVRAAGYARVSTEEQAREGISLDDQVCRIREYIAERGWECVEIFVDRGVSGSVPFAERPAGARAYAADVDVLVVVAWDRLGRDAADFLSVVRDRRVESISEAGEPPLLRDLRAVLAQEERRKIQERTKAAAFAMSREGRYNGPRPCGYRFVNGRLEPCEGEVPVVHRIYREFVAGRSRKKIATDLEADGVPTVRGKGRWRAPTVTSILSNPVYVGLVRDPHGNLHEGVHQPILERDLWDRAQQLLKAQATQRGKGRGRPTVGTHLFVRGMLRCGECGEAMVPRTPKVGRPKYICNGSISYGRDFCSMGEVPRDVIDGAVFDFFANVALDVEATRRQILQARDHKLAEVRALHDQAALAVRQAEDRLTRVKRAFQDGKIDPEDWAEQRIELKAELEAARAQEGRLSDHVAEVERWGGLIDAEAETYRLVAEIRKTVVGEVRNERGLEAARAALLRVFDRFVLHRTSKLDGMSADDLFERFGTADQNVWCGGYLIEPIIRPEALAGYEDGYEPILRREPLVHAENNERWGVGYRLVSS